MRQATRATSRSREARASQLFSQMDSNGDGVIDRREFSQAVRRGAVSAGGASKRGSASLKRPPMVTSPSSDLQPELNYLTNSSLLAQSPLSTAQLRVDDVEETRAMFAESLVPTPSRTSFTAGPFRGVSDDAILNVMRVNGVAGRLAAEECAAVVQQLLRVSMQEATRLVAVLDRSGAGAMETRELLGLICVMSHSTQNERFRVLFDVYDPDRTGRVTRDLLSSMLGVVAGESCSLENLDSIVEELFEDDRLRREGSISLHELLASKHADRVSSWLEQLSTELENRMSALRSAEICKSRVLAMLPQLQDTVEQLVPLSTDMRNAEKASVALQVGDPIEQARASQVINDLRERYPTAAAAVCEKHSAELGIQAKRLEKKFQAHQSSSQSGPRLGEIRELLHFVLKDAERRASHEADWVKALSRFTQFGLLKEHAAVLSSALQALLPMLEPLVEELSMLRAQCLPKASSAAIAATRAQTGIEHCNRDVGALKTKVAACESTVERVAGEWDRIGGDAERKAKATAEEFARMEERFQGRMDEMQRRHCSEMASMHEQFHSKLEAQVGALMRRMDEQSATIETLKLQSGLDQQNLQQLEQRVEQQELTRASFERVTQAALGEQNSLLLDTRKKTQEQFVELKEATVTDLVALQAQTTKANAQQEDNVLKLVNGHVGAEQAARQAAHAELESRVSSLLEAMRHSTSDAMAHAVAETDARAREHASRQDQAMEGFRSEMKTVLTKQTSLHESAAGMIQAIDERVLLNTKELAEGVDRKLALIPPKLQELRERCDVLEQQQSGSAQEALARRIDEAVVRPRIEELEHKSRGSYSQLAQKLTDVTDACRCELAQSRKEWLAQIESITTDQRVVHESGLARDAQASELQVQLDELRMKLPDLIGALEEQTEFNLNLIPPKLSELRDYIDEQIGNLRSEELQNQHSLKLAVTNTQHRVQQELSQIKHHTVAEMAAIASGQVDSVEKIVLQRTALMEKEMEALRETTTREVALKGIQIDSKIKNLRSEIDDHTVKLVADEERRSKLLSSKVDQMNSSVHKLREDTVSGMEAVKASTHSELSKTEAKLVSMVAQQASNLHSTIDHVREDTESTLGDLAVDVVNNRGALLNLKQQESEYHHSVEQLVESKQLSMQQQLHQFKREALAEVEAIKQASEKRRAQQERSRSRSRGT